MSTLTDAINPILADLAIARNDWIEFKGELNSLASSLNLLRSKCSEVDSNISSELAGNNSPERISAFNTDRIATESTLAAASVQHRAMASIVEMAEVYYIGLENSLKSKIVEIQGNNALFPTYVPVRPGVMSEQQPSPCRQLARDSAAMDEYRRLYKENGYRPNKPLPTV